MIGFGTILSEGPISGTPRHPSYPYTKRHELLCATMDLSTGERNSPSPRTQHRSRAISNKNRPKCVNPPKPMLSQQKSNKIHIFFSCKTETTETTISVMRHHRHHRVLHARSSSYTQPVALAS